MFVWVMVGLLGELGAHVKFHNPRTTSSGRKVDMPEERKREEDKKISKIVVT